MCLIMTTSGWRNISDGKVCSNQDELEGVFRPSSMYMARAISGQRANGYAQAVDNWVKGYLPYEHIRDAWNTTIHGAFGEEL